MIFFAIFIMCMSASLAAGIWASWSDFRGMTIPNTCSVLILLAFVVSYICAHFGGLDIFYGWKSHFVAGVSVFALTFVMFQLRMFGGGDSKLLSAYAFWTAVPGLWPLLLVMAIVGGILGVMALVIKKAKPFKSPIQDGWISRLQEGESSVPYGIAITAGAIISFYYLGYIFP